MRLIRTGLAAFAMAATLSGCLAKTAVDVVTAPVRVVSRGVDMATTSQSEADEKRGREIRKREERLGRIERSYRRSRERCSDGDERACTQARAEYDEMQALMPGVPYERD